MAVWQSLLVTAHFLAVEDELPDVLELGEWDAKQVREKSGAHRAGQGKKKTLFVCFYKDRATLAGLELAM